MMCVWSRNELLIWNSAGFALSSTIEPLNTTPFFNRIWSEFVTADGLVLLAHSIP